jgi:hypothetical protein
LKQQHKFCRKPFNEHSYHVRFQFAKWFQRRRVVKLGELWCLMPLLTIFQLYHGYLVLLGEYTEKTADLPQVWQTLNVCLFVCLMVLSATFNNISVISWHSALLVEETANKHKAMHHPIMSYPKTCKTTTWSFGFYHRNKEFCQSYIYQ